MGQVTWFTLALLLICCKTSHQSDEFTSEYDDYEDDYYDDSPQIHNRPEKDISTSAKPKYSNTVEENYVTGAPKGIKKNKEGTTTEKPIHTYEVTELLVDVPDTSTKRIPIFNNFTVVRPLNLAEVGRNQINTSNIVNKDVGDEVINAIFLPDKSTVGTDQNVQGRNNKPDESKDNKFKTDANTKYYFNKDVYDEYDEDGFKDLDFKDKPKSFRDYFHGLKKDIVTGFKSITEEDDNTGDSFHKFVNPISILSKLHRKVTHIVDKFHKSVSNHRHNHRHFDMDNDCDY